MGAEEVELTPHSLALFRERLEELAALAARGVIYAAQLARVVQMPPGCQRLMTIPGLGALTATAWGVVVRDAVQCHNGRQFAA